MHALKYHMVSHKCINCYNYILNAYKLKSRDSTYFAKWLLFPRSFSQYYHVFLLLKVMMYLKFEMNYSISFLPTSSFHMPSKPHNLHNNTTELNIQVAPRVNTTSSLQENQLRDSNVGSSGHQSCRGEGDTQEREDSTPCNCRFSGLELIIAEWQSYLETPDHMAWLTH